MSKLLALGSLVISLAAGCTPFLQTPPAYVAETAHVLPAGQVNVTGAVGGGVDPVASGHGGGGAARARVGIGGGQEIGVEGSALYTDQTVYHGWGDPTTDAQTATLAAKLSWKHALHPGFALVAGAGMTRATRTGGDTSADYYQGRAVAGDLALIGSGDPLGSIGIVPYGAMRFGLSVPLANGEMSSSDLVGSATLTLGGALPIGRNVRAFLEAGPNWALIPSGSSLSESVFVSGMTMAFYGLAGVGVTLGS
jgi:hypothetical protein